MSQLNRTEGMLVKTYSSLLHFDVSFYGKADRVVGTEDAEKEKKKKCVCICLIRKTGVYGSCFCTMDTTPEWK